VLLSLWVLTVVLLPDLDMIEAMKLASLLGKAWRKDPEAIPAGEIFQAATEAGASAIGLKAGRIAEGYLADLCLVDLDIPAFTPNHNFVSNLVYAANGISSIPLSVMVKS